MKKELLKVIGAEYSYTPSESITESYVNNVSDKNEKIQHLFKNSDNGRIFIPLKDVVDEKLVSDYGINFLNKFESEVSVFLHQRTSLTRGLVDKLLDGFESILLSELVDINKGNVKQISYLTNKGSKIGRLLNTMLDINLIKYAKDFSEEVSSISELRFKTIVGFVRDSVIGGKIANLLSTTTVSEKYDNTSLVLSINPSDFFTMSYGTSWSSCMSPNGDYGGGTLPYSSGEDTIIAFLTSDVDSYLDSYLKEWRQIIFLNKDNFVVTSKAYPNNRDLVTFIATSFISNECNLDLDVGFDKNVYKKVHLKNGNINSREFGYLDIFANYSNSMFVFAPKNFRNLEGFEVKIKSQKYYGCLQCGSSCQYSASEAYCLCEDCRDNFDGHECQCCGEMYDEDSLHYVDILCIDVCEFCLESFFTWSEWDDGMIPTEDVITALMPNYEVCDISLSSNEGDLTLVSNVKPSENLDSIENFDEVEYVSLELLVDSEDPRYKFELK